MKQGKKQPKTSTWFNRCQEFLLAFPYFLGLAIVKMLPESFAVWFFDRLAEYLATKNNITDQYRENLSRVLSVPVDQVPDELIIVGMKSYLRYWREVFRLPVIDKEYIVSHHRCYGEENIDNALREGKGLILALPHSGNWDAAGLWLLSKYKSFYTVNERLRPEKLYQKMIDYRQSLGFHVLVAGSHPYEKLKEHLLDGGIVCLLVDRTVSRSGIPAVFFGEQTLIPSGPARLAYETGAKLCPTFLSFDADGGWNCHISEPVNEHVTITKMTQEVVSVFERFIRTAPQDWHAFQPIWGTASAKVAHITDVISRSGDCAGDLESVTHDHDISEQII